jgi:hypothetical protein
MENLLKMAKNRKVRKLSLLKKQYRKYDFLIIKKIINLKFNLI